MHELSIALSIIEVATNEAKSRGVKINAVHLKLGQLAGVVKESLLFSFDLACAGTPVEGSRLIIEEVPTVIYCTNCREERVLDSIQRFCCPVCGSATCDVIQGRDLEVAALEVQ